MFLVGFFIFKSFKLIIMIETTYRDFVITYDEMSESWKCKVNDKFRNLSKLRDCKDAIDKFIDGAEKIKKKFNRFDVIENSYRSAWLTLTVTSITDDCVWVTDEKGNRQKKSYYDCRCLFLNNTENNTIIEKIKIKEAEIKKIENDVEELINTLKFLEPQQFLKELEK